MAKVTALQISLGKDKVDNIFIRRPRFSTIMRLVGMASSNSKPIKDIVDTSVTFLRSLPVLIGQSEPTEEAIKKLQAQISEKSELLAKDVAAASVETSQQEKLGVFYPHLIAETVCDKDGKKLYTVDEVDDWTEEEGGVKKVMEYGQTINKALNPGQEIVAKN